MFSGFVEEMCAANNEPQGSASIKVCAGCFLTGKHSLVCLTSVESSNTKFAAYMGLMDVCATGLFHGFV